MPLRPSLPEARAPSSRLAGGPSLASRLLPGGRPWTGLPRALSRRRCPPPRRRKFPPPSAVRRSPAPAPLQAVPADCCRGPARPQPPDTSAFAVEPIRSVRSESAPARPPGRPARFVAGTSTRFVRVGLPIRRVHRSGPVWARAHCRPPTGPSRGVVCTRALVPRASVPRASVPRVSVPRASVPRGSVPRDRHLPGLVCQSVPRADDVARRLPCGPAEPPHSAAARRLTTASGLRLGFAYRPGPLRVAAARREADAPNAGLVAWLRPLPTPPPLGAPIAVNAVKVTPPAGCPRG